jgi:bacillithiol system protein YtxJ
MNLSDRIRESESIFPEWKVLDQTGQLEQLQEASHRKPVVIFKHSTRCGISAHAKFRLEREWSFAPEDLDFYYLDLIAYRQVSNQVAETLQVTHQSPQLILLREGKAIYDSSHHMISVEELKKAMEG